MRDGPQERWQRIFDGQPLVTLQSEAPGGLLFSYRGTVTWNVTQVTR